MLAFIGAMDEEVSETLKRMSDVQEKNVSNIEFYTGKLAQKDCLVMKSGIGKVASALSTTVLFENFEVSGVVNIGTAGGLRENQEVLDIVVSEKVAYHDIDVPDWEVGFNQNHTCFKADQEMIDVVREISDDQNNVWFGNIVTGDCFVYRDDQIERINVNYQGALCAEMEGAAIAQVCRHYNCPFVIIRSLSDITHKENSELTFDEYMVKASTRSAIWCEKFMQIYTK